MNLDLRKPYLASWFSIPVLLLTGAGFNGRTVDIQLADTYYVVGNMNFAWLGSILLFGVGYWLMRRNLKRSNPTLTRLHLLLTIGPLFMIVLPLEKSSQILSDCFVGCAIALLLGQCLFLINCALLLIRSIIP